MNIILEKIQRNRSSFTAESVGVSSLCWRFQFNRIAGAFHIFHCQYACMILLDVVAHLCSFCDKIAYVCLDSLLSRCWSQTSH